MRTALPKFPNFPKFPNKKPHITAKYLLLEGVRLGAKSKSTRMGVYLAYIPIRGDELGAENDPLSQQIFLLLEGVRYNARRISRRWAVLDVLSIGEIIR